MRMLLFVAMLIGRTSGQKGRVKSHIQTHIHTTTRNILSNTHIHKETHTHTYAIFKFLGAQVDIITVIFGPSLTSNINVLNSLSLTTSNRYPVNQFGCKILSNYCHYHMVPPFVFPANDTVT